MNLDEKDKLIINCTQGGFPIVSRPFQALGERLGMGEAETLERIRRLCAEGALSRFGPVINPRRAGGNSTLAALAVTQERLEEVIALVNAHPQVSHNYEREHHFNLWFVVSASSEEEIKRVLKKIEAETALPVMNLPMEEEYFIGVNFQLD